MQDPHAFARSAAWTPHNRTAGSKTASKAPDDRGVLMRAERERPVQPGKVRPSATYYRPAVRRDRPDLSTGGVMIHGTIVATK